LQRVGLTCLFGFTSEQTVAQQLDLFLQIDDVGLVGLSHFLLTTECLKQHLLEQNTIIWKVDGDVLLTIKFVDDSHQVLHLLLETVRRTSEVQTY